MVNPLSVLGVPGELAATELASGSLGRLRAAIRGMYKNLSRYYHPDRGGDTDQMAAFSRANSEIEAASDMVLSFWIEELVDAKTLRDVDRLNQLREQVAQRGTMIRHLLSTAVSVDQFAVTGSTGPRSFLCDIGDEFDQIVLDVRSPTDTVASLAFNHVTKTDTRYMSDRRYENGVWYDVLLDQRNRVLKKSPVALSNPVSVAIIGRASVKPQAHAATAQVATALEAPSVTKGLAWHDPLTAWFMSTIGHDQKGGFVLVDAAGKRVAITGSVIASR